MGGAGAARRVARKASEIAEIFMGGCATGVNRIPIEGVPTLSRISASLPQGRFTQMCAEVFGYRALARRLARRVAEGIEKHREILPGRCVTGFTAGDAG